MAEMKTRITGESVAKFLDGIKDAQVRADCKRIASIMQKATGAKPDMWGPSIVGFGRYTYQGSGGRSTEWMQIGFSPRKANITLYLLGGVEGHGALLEKLGKHSTGRSCLYVKRLDDLHMPTLEKLVNASVKRLRVMQLVRDS